ncbi:twin-arginine translocase TatA/TatE family subunit [Halorubellus salinus]|uniref:twin-arginine translocase TatA/TatE family subunit n=1 Tax=Halorubellus salinus TaxID=755309 RepID=UPI001D05E4C2|nr:twin-arginine translocase TatA/TatE family subunit [Halorubellus salinus]
MALETIPTFIGGLGAPEMVIVFLIAVLLFGANKIPKLARSTGEAMGEFQKGREEVEDELQDMREGPSSNDESAFDDTTTTTDTSTDASTDTSTETN